MFRLQMEPRGGRSTNKDLMCTLCTRRRSAEFFNYLYLKKNRQNVGKTEKKKIMCT